MLGLRARVSRPANTRKRAMGGATAAALANPHRQLEQRRNSRRPADQKNRRPINLALNLPRRLPRRPPIPRITLRLIAEVSPTHGRRVVFDAASEGPNSKFHALIFLCHPERS